jgi:O-antigen ligase
VCGIEHVSVSNGYPLSSTNRDPNHHALSFRVPSTSSAPATPDERGADDAARWICLALVALPVAQTFSWDFDRVAPLAFVSVALWSGRAALTRAFTRIASMRSALLRWTVWLVPINAGGSVIASPHPAPALVMLSSWALLAAGGLVVGQIVAEKPERGRWLLRALAFSAVAGTLSHWGLWKLGASAEDAFYHHPRVMGLHLLGGTLASTTLFFGCVGRERIGWLLGGMVCWGGLLWTGSRAPLTALLATLFVWFALAPKPARLRLAGAGILLGFGGFVASTVLDSKVQHLGTGTLWRRTVEVSSAKELTSNRTDFWQSAWQHGWESPWLGRGPDSYRYLEPKVEGAQPHNVLLQWFLDLGLVGALALVLLVFCALWRGFRRNDMSTTAAGWPLIAFASCVAGQLDGFFYHQIALCTTAIALGISACAVGESGMKASIRPGWSRVWPIPTIASAVILILHSWIYYRVSRAPPPSPGDLIVRLWYASPTTTAGLDRWIWHWATVAPDAALSLSRHAQTHSPNGDYFRVVTAGILLRRGDRAGALQEMNHALAIAPWQRRTLVQELRDKVAAGN